MSAAATLAVALAGAAGWLAPGGPQLPAGRLAGLRPVMSAGPVLPARAVGWLRVAAAGLVAWYALGPLAGLAGAAALAGGPELVRRWRQARAAQELPTAAATFCTALVLELRAGQPPQDALARAAGDAPAELGEPLREALAAARFGAEMPAALRAAAVAVAGGGATSDPVAGRFRRARRHRVRGPVPVFLGQLAASWQLTHSSGAGLSDVVDTLGAGLRAQDRLRRETEAALAGPRATAWLLAGLPVGGIVLGAALGAHPAQVLLTHPVGRVCLCCGLALDLAGVLWVRRLVASAAGPR